MRTLTYYIAVTLDGVIAGPDGQFDFFGFEGDFAAYVLAEFPETMPTHARGPLGLTDVPHRRFDTVVMGRGTYEPGLAIGVTSPYAHLRQYVFSHRLEVDDPGVQVVSGDPVALVRELKRENGQGIWLAGGGQLAAQLLGEIDEIVIKRNPIVAGAGIGLFAGTFAPVEFELIDTQTFSTGIQVTTLRRRKDPAPPGVVGTA